MGKFITFIPQENGKPDVSDDIFVVESSCSFSSSKTTHESTVFSTNKGTRFKHYWIAGDTGVFPKYYFVTHPIYIETMSSI